MSSWRWRLVRAPLSSIPPCSATPTRQFAARLTVASSPSSTRSPTSRRRLPSPIRRLQTATGYRPHSLAPEPPPPRNTGVPSTSIASTATIDGGEPKGGSGQHVTFGEDGRTTTSISSPSQGNSSASAATMPPPTTATSFPMKARTSSKLRPRKAAMTLTPGALAQLRQLLSRPDPKLIRVGVRNRGCSGLAYHLEYVPKAGAFDEMVEQDGVKVLIDSKALFSIIGSEMDWVEDQLSSRFVFRNPNVKEQCGCGESFMV